MINLKQLGKITLLACLVEIIFWLCVLSCHAEPIYPINLWQGIMGEAIGEGRQGMYAVACVYRNRLQKGMSLGCVALKRKDLDQFIKKQGVRYEYLAKDIIRQVFEENGKDVTFGATHYENINRFGYPAWAKTMVVTIKIGNHTFFK